MSGTIRNWFWADPGTDDVRFVPNWTEHADPGGVTSCRHPRLRQKAVARSTS
jgi:hypothetical protein